MTVSATVVMGVGRHLGVCHVARLPPQLLPPGGPGISGPGGWIWPCLCGSLALNTVSVPRGRRVWGRGAAACGQRRPCCSPRRCRHVRRALGAAP